MAENLTGMKRTHMCAEVTAEDIGREIVVMGWVQKKGSWQANICRS